MFPHALVVQRLLVVQMHSHAVFTRYRTCGFCLHTIKKWRSEINRVAEIDFVSVERWSQNFQEESHTYFFIHLIEYQTKPWGTNPTIECNKICQGNNIKFQFNSDFFPISFTFLCYVILAIHSP
uniref:Uncharacterized protein n=1 Tax=Populus trichocarpa TaxID=3694 RepID=A0A2K1R4B0_POPTR